MKETDKKPYHLDKKQGTKEYIAYAFQEMLKTMPFNDITVQEIAEACQISRATFYRYFEDKYALLIWIYTERVATIYAGDGDNRQKMIDCFCYANENRRFFRQAFFHDPHNTLEKCIFQMTVDSMAHFIMERQHCDALPEDVLWSIEFCMAGAYYAWKKWLVSNSAETPEHLADRIIANSPEVVRVNYYLTET